VIDAAQTAFFVAAEEQGRAAVRPALSRKAISFSPNSIKRSGSPSASSSDDRQAGSQYWRMRAPIGVPGPMRVRKSFSL